VSPFGAIRGHFIISYLLFFIFYLYLPVLAERERLIVRAAFFLLFLNLPHQVKRHAAYLLVQNFAQFVARVRPVYPEANS
jgi:hypothetical protein